MEAVSSFHFDMDVTMNISSGSGSLDVPLKFAGDFLAPDGVKGTLSVSIAFFSIETEVISLGGTTYTKDPESGEWSASAGDSGIFTDPGGFARVQAAALEGLELVGEVTLDQVAALHVKGIAPPGALGDIGSNVEIQFWIGVEDGLFRQITADGDLDIAGEADDLLGGLAAGGAASVSITLRLSDFGKPVVIVAPEVSGS